ncbi:MAG TPA: hypothetical protein VK989_08910, partial [Polyangia bacterium]|nr:hypothetical protein [Polyangia bacterium]
MTGSELATCEREPRVREFRPLARGVLQEPDALGIGPERVRELVKPLGGVRIERERLAELRNALRAPARLGKDSPEREVHSRVAFAEG